VNSEAWILSQPRVRDAVRVPQFWERRWNLQGFGESDGFLWFIAQKPGGELATVRAALEGWPVSDAIRFDLRKIILNWGQPNPDNCVSWLPTERE
jgi:hypothetical protein